MSNILKQLNNAKHASFAFGFSAHGQRNLILKNLAKGLIKNKKLIIQANKKDLKNFIKQFGSNHPMLDRLILNEARIEN